MSARLTHSLVEVLLTCDPAARVTQVYTEILRSGLDTTTVEYTASGESGVTFGDEVRRAVDAEATTNLELSCDISRAFTHEASTSTYYNDAAQCELYRGRQLSVSALTRIKVLPASGVSFIASKTLCVVWASDLINRYYQDNWPNSNINGSLYARLTGMKCLAVNAGAYAGGRYAGLVFAGLIPYEYSHGDIIATVVWAVPATTPGSSVTLAVKIRPRDGSAEWGGTITVAKPTADTLTYSVIRLPIEGMPPGACYPGMVTDIDLRVTLGSGQSGSVNKVYVVGVELASLF
jgi:hypothetical protein